MTQMDRVQRGGSSRDAGWASVLTAALGAVCPGKASAADGPVLEQPSEESALWLFCGLFAALALHNALCAWRMRSLERVYLALYASCVGVLLLTPRDGVLSFLSNRGLLRTELTPLALGLVCVVASLFQCSFLRLPDALPRTRKLSLGLSGLMLVCAAYGTVHDAPGVRLWLAWGALGMTLWQLGIALFLASDGHSQAKGYLLAWGAFRLGVAAALVSAGARHHDFLSAWSAQIGAALELAFFGLALTQRMEVARQGQTKLNEQLTRDVDALRQALTRAEADAVAKSNLLATVAHELRTPLNAIINTPRALMQDLPLVDTATCSQCNSVFELDAGEAITDSTACPECHGVKTLQHARYRQLRGSVDEFAANLGHLERSGQHLLQLVEGILDFSRLEAPRPQLRRPSELSAELKLSPQELWATDVANDAGRASVLHETGRTTAVSDAGRATLVDAYPNDDTQAMKKLGGDALGASLSSHKAFKKERLLYVEDDDEHFSMAARRLEYGYELVRAATAEEACQRLREPDGSWAAVLMDVELRGSELDGLELAKLLRGRMRSDSLPPYARDLPVADLPILFVAAHGTKYPEATLLLAGGDKVIQKPVDFGALNVALTQLHLTRSRGKARNG